MKIIKTKISKLAFMLLATFSIISCSKKDDQPAPTPPAESYTAPVEITFNGLTPFTSSIDVLVPDVSISPCKTLWAVGEKKVGKLGFIIGNFNPAGGTIDKFIDPEGCTGMRFEGTLGASPEEQYLIQTTGGGTLGLVGKTYTLTCTAKKTNDPADNDYIIKAVWTKP